MGKNNWGPQTGSLIGWRDFCITRKQVRETLVLLYLGILEVIVKVLIGIFWLSIVHYK